jgi:hypothetical protein
VGSGLEVKVVQGEGKVGNGLEGMVVRDGGKMGSGWREAICFSFTRIVTVPIFSQILGEELKDFFKTLFSLRFS